ncbi:hypothetical protein [Actinocrispum sp. NPDC049592]|uniref:hypothetical protein n=1 Tax=Actinocrispum sp. NPDC049592 TaxID=3154835 RepID=UPI003441E905
MKKRIIWSIIGLVFGAMAIAGGLLKASHTTPNSAVDCGGKIMSPGDTCESTSKTGVKKVKTYEEQRQSNQGENYLVVGFGGLIMLISAWQLVKGLRGPKTPAPLTQAAHQNPPTQQWPPHPTPPQQQWPPRHSAPAQPQWPAQTLQGNAPQPSPPQQEWLQQTPTARLQPPPPQPQWDPSQSFGPTGEIPEDQQPPHRQGW